MSLINKIINLGLDVAEEVIKESVAKGEATTGNTSDDKNTTAPQDSAAGWEWDVDHVVLLTNRLDGEQHVFPDYSSATGAIPEMFSVLDELFSGGAYTLDFVRISDLGLDAVSEDVLRGSAHDAVNSTTLNKIIYLIAESTDFNMEQTDHIMCDAISCSLVVGHNGDVHIDDQKVVKNVGDGVHLSHEGQEIYDALLGAADKDAPATQQLQDCAVQQMDEALNTVLSTLFGDQVEYEDSAVGTEGIFQQQEPDWGDEDEDSDGVGMDLEIDLQFPVQAEVETMIPNDDGASVPGNYPYELHFHPGNFIMDVLDLGDDSGEVAVMVSHPDSDAVKVQFPMDKEGFTQWYLDSDTITLADVLSLRGVHHPSWAYTLSSTLGGTQSLSLTDTVADAHELYNLLDILLVNNTSALDCVVLLGTPDALDMISHLNNFREAYSINGCDFVDEGLHLLRFTVL